MTKQPIDLRFTAVDFVEATGAAAEDLFKFAALKQIQSCESVETRIKDSVRYQVLCDDTAMVGVIKQEASSMFAKEIVVKFD